MSAPRYRESVAGEMKPSPPGERAAASATAAAADAAPRLLEVHITSVEGLPESDPHIAVRMDAGGDGGAWATPRVRAVGGVAFVGAWCALALPAAAGAGALRFTVSIGRVATASGALDLAPYASADVEAAAGGGGEWNAWHEAVVTLRGGRRASAQRAVEAAFVRAADKRGAGEAAAAAPSAAAAESGGGPAAAGGLPAPESHLWALGSVALRLSLRCAPAGGAAAAAGATPLMLGDGALEVGIARLPRALHTYAHGGFMGLAPNLLADARWATILRREDPAAAAALEAKLRPLRMLGRAGRPAAALAPPTMMTLENSPVLCAWGLERSGCLARVGDEAAAAAAAEQAAAAPAAGDGIGADAQSSLHDELRGASAWRALALRPGHGGGAAAAARLLEHQADAAAAAGPHGYRPLGMEWDIWVHPSRPASVADASIAHGSAASLVKQAALSGVPCLRGAARAAGAAQIRSEGYSPVAWLNAFGHAANEAAHGDRNAPLAVRPGALRRWWRLEVEVRALEGPEALRAALGARAVHVAALVDSADVVLPRATTAAATGAAAAAGAGAAREWPPGRDAALSFWPVPDELRRDDLVLDVRGGAGGARRGRAWASARLSLTDLAAAHGAALAPGGPGGEVRLSCALGPPVRAARTNFRSSTANSVQLKRRAGPGGDGAAKAGTEPSAWTEEKAAVADDLEKGAAEEEQQDAAVGDGLDADAADASDEEVDAAAAAAAPGGAHAPLWRGASLRLALRFVPAPPLESAVALGVAPAAAATAAVLLSRPGGLYLDVKSAYSTPLDLQLFVSALRGLGLHVAAVCSFQSSQLQQMDGFCTSVLFFHGLSGLENAVDAGAVSPGQFVLFNGASFLLDTGSPAALAGAPGGDRGAADVLRGGGAGGSFPLDRMALRRFVALAEQAQVVAGIYVQEPATAPAAADALARLVAAHGRYLPLGFAYGHVSGRALGALDLGGRGFGSQAILEELAARGSLSDRAMARIAAGRHRGASLATSIAWADRLLRGRAWVTPREQRALVALLAEVWPDAALRRAVGELGGVEYLVSRFFEHYELSHPLTALEYSWNFNHQKALLRMLRDRGVLAALPPGDKAALARFLASPRLYSYGVTYYLQRLQVRRGLHKHAKEGLACLLESCDAPGAAAVVGAVGGPAALRAALVGRLRLSRAYEQRWADVRALHAGDPAALAYRAPGLRYAALDRERRGAGDWRFYTHSRDKGAAERARKAARKAACCGATAALHTLMTVVTLGCWMAFVMFPRVFYASLRGRCGLGAPLAVVLGLVLGLGAFVALLAVLLGDSGGDAADPGADNAAALEHDVAAAVKRGAP